MSTPVTCVVEPLSIRPNLLALHAAQPERYPYLLQSVVQGTPRARYDILFAFPGESLVWQSTGELDRGGSRLSTTDFFSELDGDWARQRIACSSQDSPRLPFNGGWFLFLAYEALTLVEPTVKGLRYDPALPLAAAIRIPAAVIYDHVSGIGQFVCETSLATDLLPMMRGDVKSLRPAACSPIAVQDLTEDDPMVFLEGVERVLEYIRAGDVFQVNLSRGWHARLAVEDRPYALYHALCTANPAPFAGHMTLPGGRAVVSSSPERLVQVRNGMVSTRPIAGTYPRSHEIDQDHAWSRELLAHPKERAEHVMLIDLERNDLGRVCQSGSVKVKDLMTLESYRHVHHIVSEVRGQLRPEITPGQVLRAVFPGGTITGCPKVRCMQIIAELEQAPRGAYTGSMGYLNRDGSMDLNILIRTMVQDRCDVRLRAGAGIVADSQPERELNETRAKARGMLAALGAA